MSHLTTRAAAELAAKELSHQTALLGQSIAARDLQLLKIQDAHMPLIRELEARIARLRADLEAWADENRKTEFSEDGKTLELESATLKYRLGQRRLELYAGMDWAGVLKKMGGPFWKRFIKRMPTIDKALLLRESKESAEADGEKPKISKDKLKEIGLRVEQDERLEIECKPQLIAEALQ